MIAWLQGTLLSKKGTSCVVAVQGIGYEAEMISKEWYQLPQLGEPLELYVQAVYREDSATLFGFFNEKTKEVFTILNTASGIGPKMALQILDTYSIEELSLLIAQGSHMGLTRVKGVGPKLAKRLIIDLKGKILYQSCPERAMQSPTDQQDAVEALVRLGYKQARALEMVQKASGMTVEEIIKSALQKEGA